MTKKKKGKTKTQIKDPMKGVSVGASIKRPKPKIDTLLVEGTFQAPSGYSSSTREFMHHFIKNFGKKLVTVVRQENLCIILLKILVKNSRIYFLLIDNGIILK